MDTLRRLASIYRGTKAGDRAGADLAKLASEDDFLQKVEQYRRNEQLNQALKMAARQEQNGETPKAIDTYKELAQRFGNTPQGAKAKVELQRLQAASAPASQPAGG